MKIFIAAIGSYGDINFLVSLGDTLNRRGHDVIMLAAEEVRERVLSGNVKFHSIISQEQLDSKERRPTSPVNGEKKIDEGSLIQIMVLAIEETYQYIKNHYEPNNTITIGTSSGFGLKYVRDKLGIPAIEMAYSPISPKELQKSYGDKFDQSVGPLLEKYRQDFGLSPLEGSYYQWITTFDRKIGAYPEWFANALETEDLNPAKPTSYVFFCPDDNSDISAELEEFLSQGEPPIAFTFGTYSIAIQDLFIAAVEACQILGKRGVFLTRYPEQLPTCLPKDIFKIDYVSLKNLLPRVNAIVHHGGAGTIGQAFRAGTPQIVTPRGFDQFDNAARVVNLGAGLRIYRADFTGKNLALTIQELLESPTIQKRSKAFSDQLKSVDSNKEICDMVETFANELIG
jgi:UDP:flavonoid glycosyltransferase YjiC (YdhE family)